jgi:hypothetical protein
MLFTEITRVYFLNHMNKLKVLWDKKLEFCNFKAGGTNGDHPVLEGQSVSDFTYHFHRRLFVSPQHLLILRMQGKKGMRKER